jgi:NDP-4-keto-2,6-dideoxyhexose 3-C-methyltransferase
MYSTFGGLVRVIETCRSCGSGDLKDVIDLGNQYLSDFRTDDQKPPRYPLEVVICSDCTLVQLRHTTPSYEMYHERYGFKSGINEAIKADLNNIVEWTDSRKGHPDTGRWLDIAANDGTLLSYVPGSYYKVGIDPVAAKFGQEATDRADEFYFDFFKPDYFLSGPRFDVITSVSMFYDLDDPNEFVRGVKSVLADDGIWVIQQNYLLTMMDINAYDNICHEHLEYYSLHSLKPLLERHGLEINDVTTSPVNGGCIRTMVTHRGSHEVKPSPGFWLGNERRAGLDKLETYEEWAETVRESVKQTRYFVKTANEQGKTVFIYGASTRGGTIWQAAGLDVKDLPYAVERNPDKFGKKIASIGVPIISEEDAREMKPDFMLVSPWFFKDVFVEREKQYLEDGGALVFPLPGFEVIGKQRNE